MKIIEFSFTLIPYVALLFKGIPELGSYSNAVDNCSNSGNSQGQREAW